MGDKNFIRFLYLLVATVRHLTPEQIYYRCHHEMVRTWWRIRRKKVSLPCQVEARSCQSLYSGLSDVKAPGPWKREIGAALERSKRIDRSDFSFLNQKVAYHGAVDWHDPTVSQLWRFHLHYFDYVEDLLVWAAHGDRQESWRTFLRLADSWISGNQGLRGDGWHPYTISIRIVNWLHALSFFEPEIAADQEAFHRLIKNLYAQTDILLKMIERDVRGNHLLKNLKALIMAGTWFQGRRPEQWLRSALRLLDREISEQVLPDGGHFERTPGYHAQALKDCLDIGLWLKQNGQGSIGILDQAVARMIEFLKAILPPDGRLPLLKDTVWDDRTPTPNDLITAGALYLDSPGYKSNDGFGLYPLLLFGISGWEKFRSWPVSTETPSSAALIPSGYYILRDDENKDYLIFDAGNVCPSYLPAHAHADLFSYELMLRGQRVIVDSGVYEYRSGLWRDFFRSTRAHNTLEVEEENQSEVWGSFRVARRACPEGVSWESGEGFAFVRGQHNGYRRLPVPVIHRRTIFWVQDRFFLVFDELLGRGKVRAGSFIHLHPEVEIREEIPKGWRLGWKIEIPLWVISFNVQEKKDTQGQLQPILQGWTSEAFGAKRPNIVLSFHRSEELPFYFGYVISLHGPADVEILSHPQDQKEVRIRQMDHVYRFGLNQGGVRHLA